MLEHLKNAREMARRAIVARERIYAGNKEAKQVAVDRGTNYNDELQKWVTTNTFKSLVADNQWNMQQSIMYSNIAIAEGQQRIISLLEQISGRFPQD